MDATNVINIEDYNMTLQEKIDKTFDSGVELIINSKNLADGVTFIEAMDVLSAFVKFAEDIIDLPQSGKYKSEVVVKLWVLFDRKYNIVGRIVKYIPERIKFKVWIIPINIPIFPAEGVTKLIEKAIIPAMVGMANMIGWGKSADTE